MRCRSKKLNSIINYKNILIRAVKELYKTILYSYVIHILRDLIVGVVCYLLLLFSYLKYAKSSLLSINTSLSVSGSSPSFSQAFSHGCWKGRGGDSEGAHGQEGVQEDRPQQLPQGPPNQRSRHRQGNPIFL